MYFYATKIDIFKNMIVPRHRVAQQIKFLSGFKKF